MSEQSQALRAALPPDVHLLVIATVAVTIRNFLIPYARHYRALGWRVDAAARGATEDASLKDAFDHVFELPLSRSIRDVVALVRSEQALEATLLSGPDLVHVHSPIAGFLTRLAVRRMRVGARPAVAYTTHGFHFHADGHAATNAAFLTAERVAGRFTDRLVVINDHDERVARRHRVVPARQLVRMPGIGIDTDWYSRDVVDLHDHPAAPRGGAGTPLFVVVGELNRNKRPEDAIRALASMQRRDASLVLAGEGPQRRHLEELARRVGVGDRVRFDGFVEDVRPIVGSATALVVPSRREGLSRAIMEALALEVPVVASAARGNQELVGADAGFVVSTGDVRGLAAAMDWLADHPAEGRAMGSRGRARIVEKYDLGIVVRMHDELYRGMLGERSARAIR